MNAETGNSSGCRARVARGTCDHGVRPVPSTSSWSPYNYPGYQTSTSGNPWYYYYPGYGYAYNYPPFPAPKAYWDPYVAQRPYSDNAGPKASGHGSP
jgi:hypothetical protein